MKQRAANCWIHSINNNSNNMPPSSNFRTAEPSVRYTSHQTASYCEFLNAHFLHITTLCIHMLTRPMFCVPCFLMQFINILNTYNSTIQLRLFEIKVFDPCSTTNLRPHHSQPDFPTIDPPNRNSTPRLLSLPLPQSPQAWSIQQDSTLNHTLRAAGPTPP